MILTLALLILGLALVVFGSDWLVDGASAIARKSGVSEFVIGLTIVGFGTSCPELVVSVTGAIEGISDIAIGNVVGSNIFNTLLILGVTSVIAPIPITSSNKSRDIPMMLLATAILVGFYFYGVIEWWGSIIMLAVFAVYMTRSFRTVRTYDDTAKDVAKEGSTAKAIALTALGLAGLVVGGRLFVENAVDIARAAGVSDKFIAVTLLAGGTSLPELATCIVAAVKKKGALALGNIIGSNIFNILLILGTSALITPLKFSGMTYVDIGALGISALIVLFAGTGQEKPAIMRREGITMLLCEVMYVWYLISEI